VPIGAPIEGTALTGAGLSATGEMFRDAAQIMMPVVSVLLLLNLVIGVITRSAPTLNIFAFGFPLTMSVTLLLLFLSTATLGEALAERVARALQHLMTMMDGLPDG